MPALTDLKETALYVDDLSRAKKFYRDLFELELMGDDDRFCAFNVAGKHVFLLFAKGGSTEPVRMPEGVIPPHDANGRIHMAFSIEAADLDAWEQRLRDHGIAIESRVRWPRGGTSLYFRDPDGHLLELLTPGVWPIY